MRPSFPILAFPILAALAATSAGQAAQAGEAPLTNPSRDVAVEYRVSGMATGPTGGGNGVQKVYFTNQGRRVRVEPPDGLGYMIVDNASGRMTVVMTAMQVYLEMPGGPGAVPMLDSKNATFRRIGADTVAGLACTVYETSNNGRKGQSCLTDDGVLLRGQGGDASGRQDMEATRVAYGPQPAALFQPPPGFQRMDVSALGGMGALLPPGMGAAASPPAPPAAGGGAAMPSAPVPTVR